VPRTEDVDFYAAVPDGHQKMDRRLREWARWCRPRKRSAVHPMWRTYVASNVHDAPPPSTPLDTIDAQRLEKAVYALPDRHAFAIRWAYVFKSNPRRAAQHIGESLRGLEQLINDGRQMLINRGI